MWKIISPATFVFMLVWGLWPTAALALGADQPCAALATIGPKDLLAVHSAMKRLPKLKKTEWETTEQYLARVRPEMGGALNRTKIGCNAFRLKLPLSWRYNPEDRALFFERRFTFNKSAALYLFDLELPRSIGKSETTFMASNENYEFVGRQKILSGRKDQIFLDLESGNLPGEDDRIETAFVTGVVEPNVSLRQPPKTPLQIQRCLNYVGIFNSYEMNRLVCSDQRWSLYLKLEYRSYAVIPASFPMSLEEAQARRRDGLYLYIDVELKHNYFGIDDYMNYLLLYGVVDTFYIGDKDGNVLVSAEGDRRVLYEEADPDRLTSPQPGDAPIGRRPD